MSINTNFSVHRNIKLSPPVLYVHGNVVVYTENAKVSIEKANPASKNPEILLLNVTIRESDGPRKGKSKNVSFDLEGSEIGTYKMVQFIVNSEIVQTCEITDSFYDTLIGMRLRTYIEGSPYTEDYIKNRINLVTDKEQSIVKVWFG